MPDREAAKIVIGLSVQDAEEFCNSRGLICRTASEDGEPFLLTCDMEPDRLNFHVEKGKIVSVGFG